MTVALADVDSSGEHQCGERNPGNPGVKAESEEQSEDEEDDTRDILLLVEVEDGGTDSEDDVENTSDPDEDLGKGAGEKQVEEREDEGDSENDAEKNEGVRVETEVVLATVDGAAIVALRFGVAVDGVARKASEAEEGDDQLCLKSVCVMRVMRLKR
jgi:hypothetical protein